MYKHYTPKKRPKTVQKVHEMKHADKILQNLRDREFDRAEFTEHWLLFVKNKEYANYEHLNKLIESVFSNKKKRYYWEEKNFSGMLLLLMVASKMLPQSREQLIKNVFSYDWSHVESYKFSMTVRKFKDAELWPGYRVMDFYYRCLTFSSSYADTAMPLWSYDTVKAFLQFEPMGSRLQGGQLPEPKNIEELKTKGIGARVYSYTELEIVSSWFGKDTKPEFDSKFFIQAHEPIERVEVEDLLQPEKNLWQVFNAVWSAFKITALIKKDVSYTSFSPYEFSVDTLHKKGKVSGVYWSIEELLSMRLDHNMIFEPEDLLEWYQNDKPRFYSVMARMIPLMTNFLSKMRVSHHGKVWECGFKGNVRLRGTKPRPAVFISSFHCANLRINFHRAQEQEYVNIYKKRSAAQTKLEYESNKLNFSAEEWQALFEFHPLWVPHRGFLTDKRARKRFTRGELKQGITGIDNAVFKSINHCSGRSAKKSAAKNIKAGYLSGRTKVYNVDPLEQEMHRLDRIVYEPYVEWLRNNLKGNGQLLDQFDFFDVNGGRKGRSVSKRVQRGLSKKPMIDSEATKRKLSEFYEDFEYELFPEERNLFWAWLSDPQAMVKEQPYYYTKEEFLEIDVGKQESVVHEFLRATASHKHELWAKYPGKSQEDEAKMRERFTD